MIAAAHSAIIFGFVLAALEPNNLSVWSTGSIMYSCIMVSITVTLWTGISCASSFDDVHLLILSVGA